MSVSPASFSLTRQARGAPMAYLRGRPLPPPHVVKQLAILRYQRSRRFRTFVETGTFTGEMVEAMRPVLPANRLDRDVARNPSMPPIRRFAGDPGVELSAWRQRRRAAACARAAPRTGACSGSTGISWEAGPARGEEDSPVRAELAALLSHPVRRHVVLIDDARLFSGADGYPTIAELVAWIERERPGRDVQVRGRHHPVRARRGRCRILALVEHPPPFQGVRARRPAAAAVSWAPNASGWPRFWRARSS